MADYSAILIDKNGPVIAALVKFVRDGQVKHTTTTKGVKDKDGFQPGEYQALGLPGGIYTIAFIGSGMKKKDWLTDVNIPNPVDTTPPDLTTPSGSLESA